MRIHCYNNRYNPHPTNNIIPYLLWKADNHSKNVNICLLKKKV
jgi:hypothetical protein